MRAVISNLSKDTYYQCMNVSFLSNTKVKGVKLYD